MPVRSTPMFLQAGSHPAEETRLMIAGLLGAPVGSFSGGTGALDPSHGVTRSDALAVSQNGTPNMSVNVAAGGCFIRGTLSNNQGSYFLWNDGTLNVAISAADSTNPRRDLIIAQARDAFYSGASNDARIIVVTGTPAASPSDPSLASFPNALVLARVAVAAGATSITTANITDLRPRIATAGGVYVNTSSNRPTSPQAGQIMYETDNDRIVAYDGEQAAWIAPNTGQTFKNAIINGDFSVNQRAFSSRTTSGYGFDRWAMQAVGGTVTHSTQAFTLGSYPVDGYISKDYARMVTSGQSAAGNYSLLLQKIEDVRAFNNQQLTVSFYARAGSGTPKIAVELLQEFGSGGSPSATVQTYAGQATLSTSWARYSVTVTLPSITGKTVGTTPNTSAVVLMLWTSAGSDFNSRTGSLGIQNATIDIWGVQVERGPVATPFEQRLLATELNLCYRYYRRLAADTTNVFTPFSPAGFQSTTTLARFYMVFPTPMRVRPVIGTSTVSGIRVTDEFSFSANTTAIAGAYQSLTSCEIDATIPANGAAGRPVNLSASNNTTSWVEFDSEF